jgi:hypothetical protein
MIIVVIVLCVIAVALSLLQIFGVIDFINMKGKKKDKTEDENTK